MWLYLLTMRELLKSKIHRARVTNNNADYVGSIVIDKDLMDKVDIWKNEKVLVANVNNGKRWETYALPGEAGSGKIEVLGAGAKLCKKDDIIIILAFEITDKPIKVKYL